MSPPLLRDLEYTSSKERMTRPWVMFDTDSDLLVLTDGSTTYKTWSYSDFEDRDCITPSMYKFMSRYVADNIKDFQIDDIVNGVYVPIPEDNAIIAYGSQTWQTRLALHRETQDELVKNISDIERKEREVRKNMEEPPFDATSPICIEFMTFLRQLSVKLMYTKDRLNELLHEENHWKGGWEDGESDVEGPTYDQCDEI